MNLALPDFRSSVNGASELTLRLLRSRLHSMSGNRDPVHIAACLQWQTRCGAIVPDPSREGVQKVWDVPAVSQKDEDEAAQNQAWRVRLISVAAPHSFHFISFYLFTAYEEVTQLVKDNMT